MNRLISEKLVRARKDYYCDACHFLLGGENDLRKLFNDYSFTFAEKRALVNARENRFKIKKGDLYVKQCVSLDNSLFTFRAILEIHQINIKYDTYEE